MSLPHATLVVLTWNTHVGAGDLGRLLADLATGRITGTAPDDFVILLQEAVESQMPETGGVGAGGRRLFFAYAPVRTVDGRTRGNAIVSTLPLIETRTIELPRERQPRAAMISRIETGGQQLFIVNAHLENRVSLWRGVLFSDAARGRQAQALVDAIPIGVGVAGGDYNTWLGRSERAWKILAARFRDTPAQPLEPTFRGRLTLDHLFFDLPDGWRAERTVLRDTYGSDHHPVVGIINK